MLDVIRRGVAWPLRSLGLDPGRALTNAQPTPELREAQRLEQWTYIRVDFDARGATSASSGS
jgi:hypothetical protein